MQHRDLARLELQIQPEKNLPAWQVAEPYVAELDFAGAGGQVCSGRLGRPGIEEAHRTQQRRHILLQTDGDFIECVDRRVEPVEISHKHHHVAGCQAMAQH